jgi:TPR repeat protein
MRGLSSLLPASFLVSGVLCSAAPACRVNVIFQHAPKTSKLFEGLLGKARVGDRAMQFEVGVAYETGSGVERDYVEAARWYRVSADQGDLAA